jgi:hypothetical protein
MRKKFVALYDSCVKDRDDHKLFVIAVLLALGAVGIAVYDVATVIRGTVDPNVHMPFLLSVALGAFAGIVLAILRLGNRRPPRGRSSGEGPYRESYQHPDHWPRGRIEAPDGTSD